jgi:hypothetical protein
MIDYAGKVISHIDGVLTYDGGGGGGVQPDIGQMVIGGTSGAVGKVLARTGNNIAGTLTLTNVIGYWADNENIYVLSELMFDGVTAGNGGFRVGDTLTGLNSGSTIVVKFIEYNIDGVVGHGKIYGRPMSAAFTNDEQLDITAPAEHVQADVADADGVGTDNDTQIVDILVDGALAVPGAANTNNCIIVHYLGGTISIPEDAHIADAITTAEGYAQKVVGSVSTGSIRVVDSDTTGGVWTDTNVLRILDCIYYDNLVAGKVFSEGAILRGSVSGAEARVLAVIDDGDNTGKLILAGQTAAWNDADDISVRQSDDTYVKYGEVEDGTNRYLDAALINIPTGVRNEQRKDQGGIYAPGSLNVIRSANALYTHLQDMYDELGQLDDLPPLEGNVKGQLYTILNDYVIPDLSFRFLEKGSFKDSGNNNIFTNIQTVGAIADIGSWGFFYDTVHPTPQPDMYIEQDGAVIRSDWLEGNLDVLLKVKTNTDPHYINPTVAALGQLINSGAFTVHVRPYLRTYDSNEVTQPGGGIAVVALGNAKDLNNTTGQYQAAFLAGGAGAFKVGEEITTTDGKRGIVTASDDGATGDVDYALKSSTNLVNNDVITGSVSGKSATINGAPSNLVAGYGTNIRVMTVDSIFTGGVTAVANFIIGEEIDNVADGGNYHGYILEDDGGDLYTQDISGTRENGKELVGTVSGATNTPTGNADQSDVPKDIGGGVGDKDYTAVVSANITGAPAGRPVSEAYEWFKFLTRAESTLIQGGPGIEDGVEGRIFRKLVDAFAEVRGASPYGTKAGALVIGAQGVYIDRLTLDTDDVRNIQLVDNLGDTYNPPNVQTLEIANLVAGIRAAVYRSSGAGLKTILRTEFKVGAVGGGYNQAGDSEILVAANTRAVSPLPNDVPDTGVLRILNPDPLDTGNYLRFIYDTVDRTNNVFHLKQGIGQNTIGVVTGGLDLVLNDNVHVVFIEDESLGASLSNLVQYDPAEGAIPLYAVARIKGKKPFETTSSFGATGVSIGAVLLTDTVVNMP